MTKFFSISRWASAKRLLSVVFFLCCSLWAMGQGTVTFVNADVTPNTKCDNNGEIKVNVNNPDGLILTYELLFNLSIKEVNTKGTFKNLSPGQYKVRVKNAITEVEYFQQDIEVPNNYVSLTQAKPKVTISGLCTSFKPGAKISVDPTSITQGTKPFHYLLVKTNDINFSDAGMTYKTDTEFDVGEFGTYMLRIKDACNEVITIKNEVAPTLEKVKMRAGVEYSEACNSGQAQLKAVTLYDVKTNSPIDATSYFNAGGVKLEMYPATPKGDAKQDNTLLYSEVIQQSNNGAVGVRTGFLFKLSPTNKYWTKITTPCGDVYEGPMLNLDTDRRTKLNLRALSTGCKTGGEPQKMVIANLNYSPFTPPGVVHFQNVVTGITEQLLPLPTSESHHTFVSNPLPMGKYKVWVKHDVCDAYDSEVRYVELQEGAGAVATVSSKTLDFCHGVGKYTSKTGTIGIELRIDGDVGDQFNANMVIESGPSNVGVQPEKFQYRYRWFNMKPGHYVVKFTTCDKVRRFDFDVPDNESLLQQEIVSTAISSCGDKGKIVSSIKYNHYFPKSIQLVDEDGNIVKINGVPQDNNVTGEFNDVPPGTYRTRIKVLPHCAKSGNNYTDFYYVYNDAPLVIVDGSQNPVFVDAQGVACEDISGNIGTKGTIYLGLAAPSGATLQYRKKGNPTWIDHPYAPNVTIANLTPGDVYEFKLMSCGKTATREVKVAKLLPIIKKGVKHPCKNKSFTLKLPYYQGAIYSWSKASDGVELGKGNILHFPKFTEANNGIYICKLQWGNCVTREVRYKLDASKCDQDLTEVVSGTVYNDDNENGKIDGTPIDKVDTKPLYIQVVEDKGGGTYAHTNIIQKVESDGSFLIDNLITEKKYRLILTTSPTAVNTASTIPSWSFVGEATGDQASDVDGTPDGMLDFVAGEGNQMDLRFGVKKQKSPAVLRSNRHITTKL